MTYEMLGTSSISALRAGCDPFDLPSNAANNGFNYNNNNSYGNNNGANNGNFPFKPLAMSFNPSPPIRPHLSMAEQAELEFELRYRGNMIVDQQRKIQQLEEELKRTRDQMDMMNNQLTSYEQERLKDKKKPQSRYWTPDEHQRFLEALNKYGHKDVKAISSHVSTRNATQVRTHAQKYFLRLERERRKKGEDDGNGAVHEGYNSSGDEMYNSDQSLSPVEDLSPINGGVSSPPQSSGFPASQPQAIPQNNNLAAARQQRRRSGSLITPSMGKLAMQHQAAVLAEMPTFTVEDYEQFVKGLLSAVDKQEDFVQVCRTIRDGFLPQQSIDDVENCYRNLHKFLKMKPAAITPIGSPKRRRTSKPELPVNLPVVNEGPLPALGVPPLINNSSTSFGFMNMSGSPLPPPQYMNANSINTNSGNNSTVSLLPFQPPVMNMNMNMNNMNMRPILDYGMPSMASLQISNMGMNNMGMMDVSSSNSSSHPWNSIALSFDLHQNTPSSLALPQGAPLVSSHN